MTLEELEQEVKNLRDENAKHRLKNRELNEELSTVKAEFSKVSSDKEGLSQSVIKLTEESKKLKAESAAQLAEAHKSASEKIKHAEVAALAIKAGLVDRDGLKLADLSKVELDENGALKGADELIKSLKEAKPYLFGVPTSTSTTTIIPKPGDQQQKLATEMTDVEYKAAKRELLKAVR